MSSNNVEDKFQNISNKNVFIGKTKLMSERSAMEKTMDIPPKKIGQPCLWKNGAKSWSPTLLELRDWSKLLKESLGPRKIIKLL